jgi:tRNA(Ile2) C34 agmatinyltransferase TiaS
MLVLASSAALCSLIRFIAPHVRKIVAGSELSKPGMTYTEVARKMTPIDGVWVTGELPRVISALQGGDQRILEIGKERVEALIKAGCPACPTCKKLFPQGGTSVCDRCGHKIAS